MRRQFPFASSSDPVSGFDVVLTTIAVVLTCFVVLSAVVGGVGLATAQSPTQPVDDSSTDGPTGDSVAAPFLDESVAPASVAVNEPMGQASNLSVTIQVPRSVVTNVTLNYSVRTSGAEGNVSVTWDFEGETKTGPDVQHAFEEAGNATIEVTVTDESGSEVTESVTVSVVNLADEESGNPIDNIGTIAVFFVGLVGVPLILLIYVLPKAMEVFTDAL